MDAGFLQIAREPGAWEDGVCVQICLAIERAPVARRVRVSAAGEKPTGGERELKCPPLIYSTSTCLNVWQPSICSRYLRINAVPATGNGIAFAQTSTQLG